MGKVFNSSCGGTSSCCLWAREGKGEDVSWYPSNLHAFTLPPFLSLQKNYLDRLGWQLCKIREHTTQDTWNQSLCDFEQNLHLWLWFPFKKICYDPDITLSSLKDWGFAELSLWHCKNKYDYHSWLMWIKGRHIFKKNWLNGYTDLPYFREQLPLTISISNK